LRERLKKGLVNLISELLVVTRDLLLSVNPLVKRYRVPLLVLFEYLEEVMLAEFVVPREVEDTEGKLLPKHGPALAKLSEQLEVTVERETKQGAKVKVKEAEHAI